MWLGRICEEKAPHLAIAAASTRIRDMEAALGTPLLNRERQGVRPLIDRRSELPKRPDDTRERRREVLDPRCPDEEQRQCEEQDREEHGQ